MKQTYTDDAGKRFIATLAGNTLTMFVPRQPDVVKLKIPPGARGDLTRAMRRTDFHRFTAAVDKVA